MFQSVGEVHENAISDYLTGGLARDATSLSLAIDALSHCSNDIVQQLKVAHELETRRQLRLLYEGLNVVQSLLAPGVVASDRRNQNSSALDVSEPAVRDIRRS